MTLPTTGGTGALPYILAGSVTVLAAGGLALWVRRRSARVDTEDSQI
ncbi:LPXTG cell wall anchor domain-containing protein [Microbacterium sp. NPDC087589]